ncbi:hypothetical protein [Saccharibacillus sp. JS10]|uniref:hypothetical protein n=1 Tax=Saccharibacillus sp. JS10 TaxID=2950552 RepID=UPI00210AF6E3|nr:hypothetical protein [Saccharibacillus sp. JS10]MCQ4087559.1 hypothetical protein [Saccharibacillus sp. JS10]
METPEYVSLTARQGLEDKVGFPKEFDDIEQDWEFIVSDSSRVDEFVQAYQQMNLSVEEKFALMMIISSSYNDSLLQYEIDLSEWEEIKNLLIEEFSIHKKNITYWAGLLFNENLEDVEEGFPISLLMKEILDSQMPTKK